MSKGLVDLSAEVNSELAFGFLGETDLLSAVLFFGGQSIWFGWVVSAVSRVVGFECVGVVGPFVILSPLVNAILLFVRSEKESGNAVVTEPDYPETPSTRNDWIWWLNHNGERIPKIPVDTQGISGINAP